MYCQVEPSTIADHVVPVSEGGEWTETNGAGCCHGCHEVKKAFEKKRRGSQLSHSMRDRGPSNLYNRRLAEPASGHIQPTAFEKGESRDV